jgi:hypothetical protein
MASGPTREVRYAELRTKYPDNNDLVARRADLFGSSESSPE